MQIFFESTISSTVLALIQRKTNMNRFKNTTHMLVTKSIIYKPATNARNQTPDKRGGEAMREGHGSRPRNQKPRKKKRWGKDEVGLRR